MDSPQPRPAIVLIAIFAVVFLMVLAVISAVVNNPVIALPTALIAAVAALGLKRGDPWAGYGIALFLCCSTAARVYAELQNPFLAVGVIVPVAIAAFAYLAGRALAGGRPRAWGRMTAWLLLAAIPVTLSLFLNLLMIPTASMEPTLIKGDTIVIRRGGASSVTRGDLVVYREPDKSLIFVKRIVAVGGDRVHLERKTLLLNGRPVSEPYVRHNTDYLDQYRDNFPLGDINTPLSPRMQQQLRQQVQDGDFVVPAGTFFVLGDNRDRSLDSRYSGIIPASAVVGKPWLVCFSVDLPLASRARWDRVLKPL